MVHHLPRYLSRRLSATSQSKVALIVVDGLALDQWLVLRDVLANQRPQLRFREGTVFAWVPTITSVSRQATFAGKPPLYFPSSIGTTGREASLWSQFWANQGLTPRAVDYVKGLGDGSLDGVHEILSRPEIRVLGLVVDKVDKIMHGMELGAAGMHNQVRQWAEEGFMGRLLDILLDGGFAVFLTSDHGNIDAEGCGRPAEGAIADLRGQRARIYPDSTLRSRVKEPVSGRGRMARPWAPRRLSGPTRPWPAGLSFAKASASSGMVVSLSKKSLCRWSKSNQRRHDEQTADRVQPAHSARVAGIHGESGLGRKQDRGEVVAALRERLKDKLSVGNEPATG